MAEPDKAFFIGAYFDRWDRDVRRAAELLDSGRFLLEGILTLSCYLGALSSAFSRVWTELVARIKGDAWKLTDKVIEEFRQKKYRSLLKRERAGKNCAAGYR